ncbi:MAG: hypothetical protein AAF922_10525 [Pseudomonadota bacterium]
MAVRTDCAVVFAGGYSDVIIRGSFQLRENLPHSVNYLTERIEQAILTAQETGADPVCRLTVTPSVDVDLEELIDTIPQSKRLSLRIICTRGLEGVPRKSKTSLDNAVRLPCLSDKNDI